MNLTHRLFTLLVLLLTTTCAIQAQDDYEKENKAENWYADRCEEIVLRFEGLRHEIQDMIRITGAGLFIQYTAAYLAAQRSSSSDSGGSSGNNNNNNNNNNN